MLVFEHGVSFFSKSVLIKKLKTACFTTRVTFWTFENKVVSRLLVWLISNGVTRLTFYCPSCVIISFKSLQKQQFKWVNFLQRWC